MRLSVLLIAILAWAFPASASGLIPLDTSTSYVELGSRLSYLVDQSGKLTIDDVSAAERAAQFTPAAKERTRVGFTPGAVWVRFEFDNRSGHTDWVLEAQTAIFDEFDLYAPAPTGWLVSKTGDSLPFASRAFAYRNLNHRLTLAPDGPTTVYLRIKTAGTIFLGFRLWSPDRFAEMKADEQMVLGGFLGVIVALALYNMFLFVALRDFNYLTYVAFLVTTAVFQASWDGFTYQYLWPESPWWFNQTIQLFAALAIVFGVLFTRTFLDTAKRTPRIDWLGKTALFLAALQIAALALDRALAVKLTVPTGLAGSLFFLVAGIVVWRRGYRPARFFVLAWGALAVGNAIVDFKEWGMVPHGFFTDYALRIGSAVEALLLSLALADRINLMRREKEKAQREALATEHRALETQQRMTASFARFVPREFLEQLQIESIVDVKLGDQVQREMTIMFSDIREFTSLSESMSPKENFDFINAYLEGVGPAIRANHGFIDKYIGDAVMALFPQDADDALQAAVSIARRRDAFNAERVRAGQAPIAVGVGLHTGSLMLGVVGEHERMEGTVISDAVNVASRIEGLTKQFGATILISEDTYRRLSDTGRYRARYLGWADVKGKAQGVSIFEICDGEAEESALLKMQTKEQFEEGIAHFFAGEFKSAEALFKAVLAANPNDKAAKYFAGRSTFEQAAEARRPKPIALDAEGKASAAG